MFGRDFSSVCGNRPLIEHIKSEIKRGSLSHAYIIEGPKGVGKHSFAECFAAGLVCEGDAVALPCGECSACKKLAASSHPDIKFIGSDGKASIGVDIIRALRTDTYIIPSEAERKIYIIEGADTMTEQAQNAFLLSLEEPPAYVTYLLLCRDSSLLLETIRSRAPSLRLSPADNAELIEFILKNRAAAEKYKRLSESDKSELAVCSGGNAGRALELLDGNTLRDRIEEKDKAFELLKLMLSDNGESYIAVSEQKKLKRENVIALLDDMLAALRDMLISKKVSSGDTLFFVDRQAASEAASPYSAKRLAFSLDAVYEAQKRVYTNAQITSALLSLAVQMRQTTR